MVQLRPGVSGAWCGEEIILLDLDTDRFYSLDPAASSILAAALNEDTFGDEFPPGERADQVLRDLHDLELLAAVAEPERRPVPMRPFQGTNLEESGPSLKAGRVYLEDSPISASLTCAGFLAVVEADVVLATQKLAGLVRRIEAAAGHGSEGAAPANALTAAVAHARLWYPRKVDCLVASAALTLLALRRGTRVELVVGVQRLPFRAHAWVEKAGVVLNDDQDVREALVPILRVPR